MTPVPSSRSSYQRAAEPHVALDHVPHVGRVVAEHQAPLDAHAEGEPRVHVGVDAAGGQYARVDDTAAAPLDPAFARARTARVGRVADARAVADEALEVERGARLGEREVVGADPGADVAEHHVREVLQLSLIHISEPTRL